MLLTSNPRLKCNVEPIMNQVKICLYLLLLFCCGSLKSQHIDTIYSSYPHMLPHSFKPHHEIIRRKIESSDRYEYIDTNGRRQFTKTETTIYDKKGRIIETYHFNNKNDDTVDYKIKFKWASDSVIHVRSYFKKAYEKGKKLILYDDYGNYKETKILSDTTIKKNYSTRVEIKLINKYQVYSITYFDYLGQPVLVYLPLLSESSSYHGLVKKTDSTVENGRLKSTQFFFSYEEQSIKGKSIEAANHHYSSAYIYDSRNRLSCSYDTIRMNNNENYSMTIITYLDTSEKVKMVHTVEPESNFKGQRTDFYYNSLGNVVRYTYDKNENDSLINDEYIINGDYIIHRYNFKHDYLGTAQNIISCEYISINGLEIEFRNCYWKNGAIYKYNYRSEKLWRKKVNFNSL